MSRCKLCFSRRWSSLFAINKNGLHSFFYSQTCFKTHVKLTNCIYRIKFYAILFKQMCSSFSISISIYGRFHLSFTRFANYQIIHQMQACDKQEEYWRPDNMIFKFSLNCDRELLILTLVLYLKNTMIQVLKEIFGAVVYHFLTCNDTEKQILMFFILIKSDTLSLIAVL